MNTIIRNSMKILAITGLFALVLVLPAHAAEGDSVGWDTSGAVSNEPAVQAPPTGGDDATSGVVDNSSQTAPSPTGGDDASGVVAGPTDTNSGGTGGGSSGVGGGSSSSSGGGSSSVILTPVVLGTSTASCPLISSYMKIGWNNDNKDVTKLQSFLKNVEKIDVAITGVYDEQTVEAVKAFQKKYMSEILGPWDATRASGVVYITTQKMVNKLACNAALTLSADELSIINNYKNSDGSQVGPSIDGQASSTSTGEDFGRTVEDNSSNVAAVGSLNIFQRFWKFIVDLFR